MGSFSASHALAERICVFKLFRGLRVKAPRFDEILLNKANSILLTA